MEPKTVVDDSRTASISLKDGTWTGSTLSFKIVLVRILPFEELLFLSPPFKSNDLRHSSARF